MSSVLSSDKRVVRLRKKLKETSFKAKTLRQPFNNKPKKELKIPAITDKYNYYISVVNKFNHLIS
jgi:hypothetical protein